MICYSKEILQVKRVGRKRMPRYRLGWQILCLYHVALLFVLCEAQSTCENGGIIEMPNYLYLSNNMWGENYAYSEFYECITYDATNNTNGVKYQWWGGPNTVKAYPANVAGWAWGYYYGQGSGGLPVRVYENHTITTSWQVFHPPSSEYESYDVSYDLWLGPNGDTNPSSPAVEVMVWLTYLNLQPIGSYQTTMNAWGAQWELWYGMNPGGWQVFSFKRTTPTLTVENQNLSDFINYLWTSNQLDGRKYLCGIQAGVELSQGQGDFYWTYTLNVQ